MFVEAPDPYRAGRILRYMRAADGTLRQAAADALLSRHGAAVALVEHAHGILRTGKRIYALADRRPLARAGSVVFQGGALALFLGAYAVASCPDPRAPRGSAAFATFQDLETLVLRGAAGSGL